MNIEIVVVGSYNQDLSWICDEFPKPGETILGKFNMATGGKGSNQAVAASRTGIKTAFVGSVGNDSFGEAVKQFYANEGIEYFLTEQEGTPTGTAGIVVNNTGQNEIIVSPGANEKLSPADIPENLIRDAQVVICQFESKMDTTAHVLKIARHANVTTILNPAPMRLDFNPGIIDNVDILIPNEIEFTSLLKSLRPELDEEFSEDTIHQLSEENLHQLCRNIGIDTIIVTLGNHGCFVSTTDDFKLLPASSHNKVVDSTGAGDAFVGAFASGYVQFNKDIFRSATFGNLAAGLSVMKSGAAPSMPYKDEITSFSPKHI